MNTKEAIALLESKGWKVYDDGRPEDYEKKWSRRGNNDKAIEVLKKRFKKGLKLFRVWSGDYFHGVYTGRELITIARNEGKGHHGHMKANLKHFDHCTNRRAQRDLIANERFEDIPLNKKIHEEDRWSWD